MSPLRLPVLLLLAATLPSSAQTSACTGLCQQQVTCPNGGTTSISGTVYTPNGSDPLPNVLVYIPNAPVDAFTPGVSCPVVGQPPSGSPLVGTTSAVDGTFTITNVPVGTSIPLVIQSGRWRRQLVVPATTACANTSFNASMPANQSQGDIPKFAIATGALDQVECVLRKVGISDSEFTDPTGTGRINLFSGSGAPGALIDSATPNESALMGTSSTLNSYDVLMLPCEGSPYPNVKNATEYSNLVQFANSGGRVYASHFSYQWMYQNSPFNTVAHWDVDQSVPNNLSSGQIPATVNTTFSEGATLAQWLQIVGASTTPGQINVSTVKHDLNGVIAPTQSWLTLNDAMGTDANPVMQFVFNAPVGTTANQCGRVLFNEYHVENPTTTPKNVPFPNECPPASTPMTPQEKLLEYSLFELTNDGGQPTLSPLTLAFGSEPLGFTSAPQSVTWTNNSTFPASTVITTNGDFIVTSNPCSTVAPGSGCQIGVSFRPTALGARTGTLSVASSGSTLTATLSGTGTPALLFSLASVVFGNVDVGASAQQSLSLTNSASGPVTLPGFVTTGSFSASSNCPSSLAANASCTLTITFSPTSTGPQTGSLALSSGGASAVTLSGTGVDFSVALAPSSGSVIAGNGATFQLTTTPIAGFSNPVSLSCAIGAAASTCIPAATSITPTIATKTSVSLTTTSKYTVVGYVGLGGPVFWIFGLMTGGVLWISRQRVRRMASLALFALLIAATLPLAGCSGKTPAENAVYTLPGTYTVTVSATDGFLTHSATYTLTVTSQ